MPQLQNAPTFLGSRALNQPFSSYVSLLAEVGVFGFVLMVGIYGSALLRSGRMALMAMRNSEPGDPLPALLLASTIAFLVLLQMAFLQNWLEVTRVTIPSWILLAVSAKEFAASRAALLSDDERQQ